MHVSNSISPKLLAHFFRMVADGAIMESDVEAFVQNPRKWRKDATPIRIETAQAYWQEVWDELLGIVVVPPVPTLTAKQMKSMAKFGFMLMYLPAITTEDYPPCFVKSDWGGGREVLWVINKPLQGRWIAVEAIRKPNRDDHQSYPEDRLMAVIKHESRSKTHWGDLRKYDGIFERVADVTGFPKGMTRLPTAEEMDLIGNLMNWIREFRFEPGIPDLLSAHSWEWVGNQYSVSQRHCDGGVAYGAIAEGRISIEHTEDGRNNECGFRVLVEL